jgi:hypothetical protein
MLTEPAAPAQRSQQVAGIYGPWIAGAACGLIVSKALFVVNALSSAEDEVMLKLNAGRCATLAVAELMDQMQIFAEEVRPKIA